tara:strand:+ start:1243 stop:1797 length:555 start_codon:yes stop_codon:yes gene_type:complete
MANPMYGQNKADNLLDEVKGLQAVVPYKVVETEIAVTITAAANSDAILVQPANSWLKDVILVAKSNIVTAGASGDDLDMSVGTSAGGTQILGGAAKALLDDGGSAETMGANIPVHVIKDGAGYGANAFVNCGITNSEANALQAINLYSTAARNIHFRFTPLAHDLASTSTIKIIGVFVDGAIGG